MKRSDWGKGEYSQSDNLKGLYRLILIDEEKGLRSYIIEVV
jgi:hypothetical protein